MTASAPPGTAPASARSFASAPWPTCPRTARSAWTWTAPRSRWCGPGTRCTRCATCARTPRSPLSEGEVYGHTIECWLHGSCFDVRTGVPTGPPATVPVPVYPVKTEDGDVYVAVS